MTTVKDSNGKEFKFYNVAKDDYPELEGKLVKVKNSYDTGITTTGMVVGCNAAVGVTIVDAENKDSKLLCFQGPVLPGTPNLVKEYDDPTYVMALVIEQIAGGEVDIDIFRGLQTNANPFAQCGGCAYSQ